MKKTCLFFIVLIFLMVLIINIYTLIKLIVFSVEDPVGLIRFLLVIDIVAMSTIYVGFKFVKRKTKPKKGLNSDVNVP